MIRALALACAVSIALTASAFADDRLVQREDQSDEAYLRHFKTVLWQTAYRTQDAALLDAMLHDSFELITNDGTVSTKAQELEGVRASAWDPGTFEYRIERLQVYQGAFAVIAGTGVAESYTYASSNFLVKEDGRWQAIASHVSGYRRRDGTE